MKRIMALILVISTLLSLAGCVNSEEKKEQVKQEIKDAASNAVNNAINDAKEQASEWLKGEADELKDSVNETVEKAQSSVGSWWDDLVGNNNIITYCYDDSSEVFFQERFKAGKCPTLTDKKPTRPGYHFIGWSRTPGGDAEFASGKPTFTELRNDTILYACWEEYHPDDGLNTAILGVKKDKLEIRGLFGNEYYKVPHKYTLDSKNNVIRITCDCGFELIDRNITMDRLVNVTTNGRWTRYAHLSSKDQKKYDKYYVLYRTQDYAPFVLSFIGAFYADVDPAAEWDENASNISEFFDTLQRAADLDLEAALAQYSVEYTTPSFAQTDLMTNYFDEGETIAYALSKKGARDNNKICRETARDVFGTISDAGGGISMSISLARGLNYSYDAFAGDSDDLIDRSLALVKAVHVVIGFCQYVGDYYDQLFSLLEDGLDLYAKCVEKDKIRYALYNTVLDRNHGRITSVLTVDHVEQASLGHFEKAPTAMEVIASVLDVKREDQRGFSALTDDQKKLVSLFITMRLEHDLKSQYGITLDEYIAYVK